MEARRQQDNTFKVLKEKKINQEAYTQQNYPSKTFLVKKKKKLKEFITTKSAPQEMLERVLQTEMKGHYTRQ